MVNCAIVGATGYTGVELIKILLRHSYVQLSSLTTRKNVSIPVHRLAPELPHDTGLVVKPYSFAELKRTADIVFLCLPHTEAARTVKKFRSAGKIVIDLSADFRLKSLAQYKKWYGVKHRVPELVREAVYGLPELYRDDIQKADLIANPGCYPTGAILGIAPLLKAKAISGDGIIINAASGVSGAGRKANPYTQFYELDENFYAYRVGKHQHTPEIEQTLTEVAKKRIEISLVTHLLPVQRGILCTIHLKRRKGVKPSFIRRVFEKYYENEPFVRVLPEGNFPAIKDVRETNFCDIGILADSKRDRVIVVTAIDNLTKGASGQAVQNMNIRLGFPEKEGLSSW